MRTVLLLYHLISFSELAARQDEISSNYQLIFIFTLIATLCVLTISLFPSFDLHTPFQIISLVFPSRVFIFFSTF